MKHPWDSQAFRRGARLSGRDEQNIEAGLSIARAIKGRSNDLPVIFSLSHLAHLVDIQPKQLRAVTDRLIDPYRVFRLRKRSGGKSSKAAKRRYRDICVPSPALMRTQRWVAQNILNALDPHYASHGFAPKSQMLDAAQVHCGRAWLLKMDLRNFFESITEKQVYWVFRGCGYTALLSFELARLCTRSKDLKMHHHQVASVYPHPEAKAGYLPQGAPSSPMLANLAVYKLDEKLTELAQSAGWRYTRYADDLAFSTDSDISRKDALWLKNKANGCIRKFGLETNHQKTTISPPGARKILLGVLVDRETPKLTRQFKDNIETHLYALTNPKIGVEAHLTARGFNSVIGMRHHLKGLISFAHYVDPNYATRLYNSYNNVSW